MVIGPRFYLRGFEPAAVRAASRELRRAFWLAVSQFVGEEKQAELKAGLDRYGDKFQDLAESTVKNRKSAMGYASPFAPPLTPAYGTSRTRALFVAQPTVALDGVTCSWRYDSHTGASWGEILRYHKAGKGRLPIRDTIGLSPHALSQVRIKAAKWWVKNGTPEGEPEPTPAWTPGSERFSFPKPERVKQPVYKVERVKPYKPKHPENAVPKDNKRVSQIKINEDIYTLQTGTAAQLKRAIDKGTFSGFGKTIRNANVPIWEPGAFTRVMSK